MTIFKSKDFNNLANVRDINKNHYGELSFNKSRKYKIGYYDNNYLEQAKSLVKRVKPKLKDIEKFLKPVLGKGYKTGVSYIKKEGGGGTYGFYRPNLWVWITDIKLYSIIKSKVNSNNPAQLFIPQLQVGISDYGVAFAEIWLEPIALRNYGEKLLEILKKSEITKENLCLYIQFKDKNIDHFDEYYSKSNYKYFESFINNNEALKAGVIYFSNKSEVIDNNITNKILKYVKIMKNELYIPLIGKQPKIEHIVSYIKPPERKSALKINLKEYIRKGSKPAKVSKTHEKIKNKLINKLEIQFPQPDNKIEIEKNFVDITVEGKDFIYLYEIKTKENPVRCIRDAIGQLLYYLWANGNPKNKEIKLFVVGETEIKLEADSFYNFIKKKIDAEIEYEKVNI